MNRIEFEAAVARLEKMGMGRVTQRDWPAAGERIPYRRAELFVDVPASDVETTAGILAAVTCEVDGFLTMTPWMGRASFHVAVCRDLDETEAKRVEGRTVSVEVAS